MPPPFASSIPPSATPFRSDRLIALNSAENKKNTLVFLVIGALIIPYSVAVYIGDLKLTPIKILIVALILPAGLKLILAASRGQRSLLASDAYALGVFILMFLGPLVISGSRDFVTAFSQAIEFYGMYVIGRTFVFENSSMRDLTRGLQIATIVVVTFGILDIIFQRYAAQELASLIFRTSSRDLNVSDPNLHRFVLGISSLRATSTFDHPILFGAFCAAVVPLHLYAPMSPIRRFFLVTLCIVGCLVALSSAPLLALFMAAAIYFYDLLMHRYVWRWKLLLSSLLLCIAAFSFASDDPLSWLFRNLTLDPQTAYFRLLMWDAGVTVISDNPWLGIGFNSSGDRILDFSTDSLLLAKAIHYGIPMTTLLYLAAVAATVPARGQAVVQKSQPFFDLMCTSFSMILAVIMFISITVTFWNAMWLFFALCIGVRTSLKERCLLARRKLLRPAG
jgi:O-Antigen ligase